LGIDIWLAFYVRLELTRTLKIFDFDTYLINSENKPFSETEKTNSTFFLQPTAYSLQPTAYSLQPTAYSLQPTAYSLQPQKLNF
jgi:hypothetical protein